MAVSIKSEKEIELMGVSCKNLSVMFDELEKIIKPGISTWEINKVGEEIIRDFGCIPNFKNYEGYPASICTSVNEVVVHGIPSKKRISKEARQLVDVTRQSFFEGIRYAKAGNHLHDISAAIQKYAESFGYGVVRELVGHGIGTHLHEDPQIPNFKTIGRGIRLRPGMTLAIEPMITMGDYAVSVLDDDWTVVTDDNSLAAHYENTVLITEGDPEILTLPNWDKKEWQ